MRHKLIPTRPHRNGSFYRCWRVEGREEAFQEAQGFLDDEGIPVLVQEDPQHGRPCNISVVGGQKKGRRAAKVAA